MLDSFQRSALHRQRSCLEALAEHRGITLAQLQRMLDYGLQNCNRWFDTEKQEVLLPGFFSSRAQELCFWGVAFTDETVRSRPPGVRNRFKDSLPIKAVTEDTLNLYHFADWSAHVPNWAFLLGML